MTAAALPADVRPAVVLRRACRAEWTKLRTEPGFWWLLASVAAVTVAIGAAVAGSVHEPGGDPARLSLSGVTVSQAVVAVLAVLSVSGEYGTGMVHVTLAAVPRRSAVLAAKGAVLGGCVAAAGAAGVLGSLLAGHALLPGAPAMAEPAMLRAAFGTVLYLVLVALLALGVAFAVRDGAAAAGVVLALLYLFPLLSQVVSDPWLQRQVLRAGPMPAGLAVQSTTSHALPIGPWPGLGVLALWAAACVAAGGAALHGRDA